MLSLRTLLRQLFCHFWLPIYCSILLSLDFLNELQSARADLRLIAEFDRFLPPAEYGTTKLSPGHKRLPASTRWSAPTLHYLAIRQMNSTIAAAAAAAMIDVTSCYQARRPRRAIEAIASFAAAIHAYPNSIYEIFLIQINDGHRFTPQINKGQRRTFSSRSSWDLAHSRNGKGLSSGSINGF
jgi:hypothetical protein